MKIFIFAFAILVLSVGAPAIAEPPPGGGQPPPDNHPTEQVITLKDGSKIVGEVIGLANGVYTIKAPIIGNITANANDVISIVDRRHDHGGDHDGDGPHPIGPEPIGPNPPGDLDFDHRIAVDQKRLMSNPQDMALLMQLTQDPSIMQALQDPAVVEAVEHHDYQAIANNPKVMALMNLPQMQALLKELAASMHHDHDHDNPNPFQNTTTQ